MPHPRGTALLVAAAALAGCTGDETVAPPSYALDCALSNWDEACNAHASPNDSPSKTEIDLAVSPTDPLHVFVASKDLDPLASDCVWSVGQVTTDGGRTWTTVYVGGTLDERSDSSHPLFGWTCVTDPILAFDSVGTLYYPLQAYDLGSEGNELPAIPLLGSPTFGSAFFLAVSEDGGLTFPADRIITMAIAEGNLVFHDYPRMAVSPTTDSVSTVWNAVGAAGVNPYVVTTRDGGESVGPPTIVATPMAPRSTIFASGYAAGPDGEFYMTVVEAPPAFLLAGFPDTYTPLLAVSADDAQSFMEFVPMFEVTPIDCPLDNTQFRCGTSNELAVDSSDGPFRGRIYAVWDDGRNGNADVLVAWSDDRGAAWSEPAQVTLDGHDQFMARATVDARGTLHLVYLDRQYDANNTLLDATHSWTADGAQTWHHERLTTRSFDGDLGIHQDGFPFIGDYIGIGASGDHVWMGFPTTRTGRAEIAVAHAVAAHG